MQFFTLVSAATAVVIFAETPLKSCGKVTDILKINSIDVTPYPLLKGSNVTITASGSISEPIFNGSIVNFSIKAGLIPLYSGKADLCEAAGKKGQSCPLATGPQQIVVTQAIPENAPTGTFGITVSATNADGKAITCFSGNLQIK